MDTTEHQLHLASQYIANAARQYLPAESDDSHTAMTWDVETSSFVGKKMPDGSHLALRAETLTLVWFGNLDRELDLQGRTHGEIIVWMHHVAVAKGHEEFEFSSPYYLGRGWENPTRTYSGFDLAQAQEAIERRNVANEWGGEIARRYGEKKEVLIWPHHFDTALLLDRKVEGVTIGTGLAVPDEVHNGHYFYISAYKKGRSIKTEDLDGLAIGEWKQGDFEGAILPFAGSSERARSAFAIEAIEKLLAA